MAMNVQAPFPPASLWTMPNSDATRTSTRFVYDGPSDTMFIDFFGEGRPAASIALDIGDQDFLYARVDPETNTIVGFQVEDFLSYAVKYDPRLLKALAFADIRGVSPKKAESLRDEAAAAMRGAAGPRAVIDELVALIA